MNLFLPPFFRGRWVAARRLGGRENSSCLFSLRQFFVSRKQPLTAAVSSVANVTSPRGAESHQVRTEARPSKKEPRVVVYPIEKAPPEGGAFVDLLRLI